MNITQKKVAGHLKTIDIAVNFSEKEYAEYSVFGFKPIPGEFMELRKKKLAVHAYFSIDQLQANNTIVYLGYGKTNSEKWKNNGLYYSMKLEETNDKQNVNGKITYIVEKVKLNQIEYKIKKEVNGSPIKTTFTYDYEGKSEKNSTLFIFFRELVKIGYINFLRVPTFFVPLLNEKKKEVLRSNTINSLHNIHSNKTVSSNNLETSQEHLSNQENSKAKLSSVVIENRIEPDEEDFESNGTLQSHSWIITNKTTAVKELDKSAFLHNGTGIPVEIRNFFNCSEMSKGERKDVKLYYKGSSYSASIQMDRQSNPRTRLFWKSDFSGLLRIEYPDYFSAFMNESYHSIEPLVMTFEKVENNDPAYQVSFGSNVNVDILLQDIEADIVENTGIRQEGTVKYYYGKRYERDATNRKRAIMIHGLKCFVCKFDFEKIYGERGKDFIEVHHTKPLYTLEGQITDINPVTDLVPLCANCHRMIHRRHDNVLSIEQLKQIIMRNEK